MKSNFVVPKRSIVHFDGKLLSDLSGNFGERLAVVISGNSPKCQSGFLISANRLSNGTGSSISQDVLNSLKEWNISSTIVGMVFDTTSANTGWLSGAATMIETGINR